MKKYEPKTEVLYVRVSKSFKKFIADLALKRFGKKRSEAKLLNDVFEELQAHGKVSLKEE